MIAGLLIAACGGTAIAIAAVGAGPVPPPKRLADAVRQALAAKAPDALSADITFTNNLIGASEFQGSDPLLSGASGRLWMNAGHLRLELQSDSGDAQIVAGGHSFFVYDPASDTAYEGSLRAPAATSRGGLARHGRHADAVPSLARIQTILNRLAAHLRVSGARPSDVAGRPAYRVAVSPRRHGGLLGDLQLAWDAARGVPLDFGVYARGSSSPVLELKVTSIAYGPVAASTFAITPPAGAKVVKLGRIGPAAATRSTPRHQPSGPRRLDFRPVSPSTLAGRARSSVRVIDWGGRPAELLTYGRGLDAIAVVERRSGPKSPAPQTSGGDGQSGLSLPTVSIGGESAQQLATALGTVLQFTRGGVSYLVAGSVSTATADAAARALS